MAAKYYFVTFVILTLWIQSQAVGFEHYYEWELEDKARIAFNFISYSGGQQLLMGGPSDKTVGYAISPFATEITSSDAFTLSPQGYSGCANLNGGFLADKTYTSLYYLTFTCFETSSKKYSYFLSSFNLTDNSLVETIVLTLSENATVEPKSFPVAFLDSQIVLAFSTAEKLTLVGFSGALKVNFETTVSSNTFVLQSLSGQPESDDFILAGLISKTDTYIATFGANGKLNKHISLSLASEEEGSILMTSSGAQFCYNTKDSVSILFLTTSLEASSLVAKKDGAIGTPVCLSGLTDQFGMTLLKAEDAPTWLFSTEGKETLNFESKTDLYDTLFLGSSVKMITNENGPRLLVTSDTFNDSGDSEQGVFVIDTAADSDDFYVNQNVVFAEENVPGTVQTPLTWSTVTTLQGATSTTSKTSLTTPIKAMVDPVKKTEDKPDSAAQLQLLIEFVLLTVFGFISNFFA